MSSPDVDAHRSSVMNSGLRGHDPPHVPDPRNHLPRQRGTFRRRLAANRWAVDLAVVVFYVLACAMMTVLDMVGVTAGPASGTVPGAGTGKAGGDGAVLPEFLGRRLLPLSLLRLGVVVAALLLRRRYPLAGLFAVSLAMFGEQGGQVLANSVALLCMLYSVPVYRSVPAGWFGYGIAVACSLAHSLVPVLAPEAAGVVTGPDDVGEHVFTIASSTIWLLASVLVGINIGNRRRYLEAILARADQLARERDQRAQLAVAEERSRIAGEMHDIVAHSLSVMVALSEGSARAAVAAPDAAVAAMERSAETGRAALGQIRRLLGALSDSGERDIEFVPGPGVEDLPMLVRGFEEAGLDVELDIRGAAVRDPGQEQAVYRVVQEGVTNVLRHAGPSARAVVTVVSSHDGTEVSVQDNGPTAPGARPMSDVGSGRGLRGLAERVRVFGGSLESAALSGGGWTLHAVIPASVDVGDRSEVEDPPEVPHE